MIVSIHKYIIVIKFVSKYSQIMLRRCPRHRVWIKLDLIIRFWQKLALSVSTIVY
jgi:hypothetical protein